MTEPSGHISASDIPSPEWRNYVLGFNVQRLRKKAKIQKCTFCLMIGISRPYLDRIENGTVDPRVSVIEKMAAALETTPQSLLTPPFEPFPLPKREEKNGKKK